MKRNRSSKTKISNIYIQGVTTELKLYSLSDLHSDDREENKSEEMEENDALVKVGIASARDRNLNYKSLLIDIGLVDMNNNHIFDCLLKIFTEPRDLNLEIKSPKFKYLYIINNISTKVKNQIISLHSEVFSWRSLAAVSGLHQATCRKIINESK